MPNTAWGTVGVTCWYTVTRTVGWTTGNRRSTLVYGHRGRVDGVRVSLVGVKLEGAGGGQGMGASGKGA